MASEIISSCSLYFQHDANITQLFYRGNLLLHWPNSYRIYNGSQKDKIVLTILNVFWWFWKKLVWGICALSMFQEKIPDLFETRFTCLRINRISFIITQCIVKKSPEFSFSK